MKTMNVRRSPVVILGVLVLAVVLTASLFLRYRTESETGKDPVAEDNTLASNGRGSEVANEDYIKAQGSKSPATDTVPSVRWELLEGMSGSTGIPEITKEDAERFLEANGATAINLLGVASLTNAEEFLRRAAELFPDHPAVHFALLSKLSKGREVTPEMRAEWIARFKASAPDSPLPFIYAAREALWQNDAAIALAEMSGAVERPGLYLWSSELVEVRKRLFETKGLSPLEAETVAMFGMNMPYVQDLRELGNDLIKLYEPASTGGRAAESEAAIRAAYDLGEIFQSPEGARMLLPKVLGLAIQEDALKALPPDFQPSFLHVPRAQSEAEIAQARASIRELTALMTAQLGKKDPNLLAAYLQRIRSEGEYQALLWLKEQAK